MQPHFNNPIPSDFNRSKVKFYPFDYDYDNNKPKRYKESKWVKTDKYINSKEGNNILDEGSLDELQKMYDHLFVQMDDRMEHTEMFDPKYNYEADTREGELLYTHSCIYEKTDDTLQLRNNSFLRIFDSTAQTLKVANQNYIEIEDSTINTIEPSDHAPDEQRSEVILKNCSGLQSIKGFKYCTITLENCDISQLIIEDNEKCEFYLSGGSLTQSKPITKNKKCLFELSGVTSSGTYCVRENENLMFRHRGSSFNNSEYPFSENTGLAGELLSCKANGNNWLHYNDEESDLWYEGLSVGGNRHGCAISKSVQFMMYGCSNQLAHYCHKGKGLHVHYDQSTVGGQESFYLEENSNLFSNDSQLSSMADKCVILKDSEAQLFNSKVESSPDPTFDLENSYVDSLYTQIKTASAPENFKMNNSYVNIRRSSKVENSVDKNFNMTGGGVMVEDSELKALTENIQLSGIEFIKSLRSSVTSDTKDCIKGSDLKWIEFIDTQFDAVKKSVDITSCGEGYFIANTFKDLEGHSVTGDDRSRLYVHSNTYDTQKSVEYSDFNTLEMLSNQFQHQVDLNVSTVNELIFRKNTAEKPVNISECHMSTKSNEYQKDVSISKCTGRLDEDTYTKNLSISDSYIDVNEQTVELDMSVSNSIANLRNNSIILNCNVSDSITRAYKNTISVSLSMDGVQQSLSNTASTSINYTGLTLSKNNSAPTITFDGCSKSLNDSTTINLFGTGEINGSGSPVTTNGNFHVTNISNATASGVITSNASTINSISGAGVATGGNDPSISGIQMTNLGGTSEVKSSLFHYDKSDVFHHTKAPTIDHN